jgi:subtilisin family serine protease
MSVGNYDDRNTISWADDTIQPCSSYRNPKSLRGDREKPEVAAPGTNINSTTVSAPWTGPIGSGTSFSAPVVAGAAGLLINRAPWIAAWPESIKAVLMTTALNNIEGEERLSEYDGAGGVSLDYADDVAANVRGSAGGRPYACSDSAPIVLATMDLVAGKNTRAAIVWAQNPAYEFYEDQPSADLDLQVLDADDTLVASSTGWDNPFEIVQFTPTASGSYTLRVLQSRCSLTPARLGWAWHHEP